MLVGLFRSVRALRRRFFPSPSALPARQPSRLPLISVPRECVTRTHTNSSPSAHAQPRRVLVLVSPSSTSVSTNFGGFTTMRLFILLFKVPLLTLLFPFVQVFVLLSPPLSMSVPHTQYVPDRCSTKQLIYFRCLLAYRFYAYTTALFDSLDRFHLLLSSNGLIFASLLRPLPLITCGRSLLSLTSTLISGIRILFPIICT